MEARKMYFMNCHLAGRKYHDADEVWDELKVGTVLQLVRDKGNVHDPEGTDLSPCHNMGYNIVFILYKCKITFTPS